MQKSWPIGFIGCSSQTQPLARQVGQRVVRAWRSFALGARGFFIMARVITRSEDKSPARDRGHPHLLRECLHASIDEPKRHLYQLAADGALPSLRRRPEYDPYPAIGLAGDCLGLARRVVSVANGVRGVANRIVGPAGRIVGLALCVCGLSRRFISLPGRLLSVESHFFSFPCPLFCFIGGRHSR